MVEETNAAGATLASEAARLKDMVSHFRLGGASATLVRQAENQAPVVRAASPRARWSARSAVPSPAGRLPPHSPPATAGKSSKAR